MKNQMTLAMRSEEGRVQVSVSLEGLSRAERVFLFGLLQGTSQGGNVAFCVMHGEHEQTKLLQFVMTNPLKPTAASSIREALRSVN